MRFKQNATELDVFIALPCFIKFYSYFDDKFWYYGSDPQLKLKFVGFKYSP